MNKLSCENCMIKNYKNKLKLEYTISECIHSFFESNKPNIKANDINIHFIGCGGIGMCGLSILCKQFGFNVTGSDLKNSRNTNFLIANNITVHLSHSINNIPKKNNSIIVYSSAVNKENIELKTAIERGIPIYRRGEFLAFLSNHYKTVISIAGSHGKTTVTSMLAHILKETSFPNIGYLIGGWPVGQNALGGIGDGNIFVIEVDESDLSLTLFKSEIGVILNIDDDHSWNVGGNNNLYNAFLTFANNSKTLVYINEKKINTSLKKTITPKYKVDLENIENFSVLYCDKIYGKYQIENAQTAISVALKLGVNKMSAIQSLKSFQGVERRMQKVYSNDRFIIYEDYAHHPSEIRVAVTAIKKKYPTKKLTVIFQPHRYARLKFYFNRFRDELNSIDKVFIVPTFSAWANKENISEQSLAESIGINAQFVKGTWDTITSKIYKNLNLKNCVILVLGAGDINCIIPKLITRIESNSV